jgi:transcriptional regulator with XRE-family HTH domain
MEVAREKRKAVKMSQAELSFQLGKNDSFVAQVEADHKRLKYNVNHVNALAKIFKCSPKEFLPENPV